MSEPIDTYPTAEQIEQADHEQICKWYRFLRIADNKNELVIIELIRVKFVQLGGCTSEISKRIGW